MRRVIVAFLLCAGIFCFAQSEAQVPTTGAGLGAPGGAPAAYTGPLDVVGSNVVGCWALRACSSAARGNAAINVCNVSDIACADWLTDASTGALVPTTVGGSSCAVVVCTVKTIYDQSGALACAGSTACDLVDATINARGTLVANCINTSHYCIAFTGGEGYNSANALPTITQPYTQSLVVERTGNTSAGNTVFTSSTGGDLFGMGTSANLGALFNGTYGTWTATDNAWNAQSVVSNAGSSIYNDNGTAGSPSANPGTGNLPSGTMQMGYYTGAGTLYFGGNFVEGVFWKATSSAGQLSSIVSNQRGSSNAGWNF